MAKVSSEAKRRYGEKIKEYRSKVDQMLQHEKSLLHIIESEDKGQGYKRLALADENLNMVSYYLLMNHLSISLLGIKNEGFLNNARKTCYKSIIYLEDVVSSVIDAPYSEYEKQLEEIADFTYRQRWDLLCKLGFTIEMLVESYGSNSKWKWSFVELEGRFATVSKNMLNLKEVLSQLDPRFEGYPVYVEHIKMVKRLLENSANNYRQKYELSTSRIEDFKLAIRYLAALRRLHILLGESQESEVIKKKIDIWKSKMEADSKNREQLKKLK